MNYPTRGRISAVLAESVIFKPAGTNYQLRLQTATPYDGPIDEPLDVMLRATARKVYTVPSGGNFIAPIFGPPRIIQGRIKYANDAYIVVHAGANFIVELPGGDSAIDLNNGLIRVGTMINVVAFPGATLELVVQSTAAALSR